MAQLNNYLDSTDKATKALFLSLSEYHHRRIHNILDEDKPDNKVNEGSDIDSNTAKGNSATSRYTEPMLNGIINQGGSFRQWADYKHFIQEFINGRKTKRDLDCYLRSFNDKKMIRLHNNFIKEMLLVAHVKENNTDEDENADIECKEEVIILLYQYA
jgi:hypothetical protein